METEESTMAWTESDIPDLSGKTAIVTGANSGLGFETARMMAENGATVVMACRDLKKGRKAREKIEDGDESADLRVMELDLASLDSIHSFASRYREGFESLDILVNNAGVMMIPWKTTEFEFEYQFGVNHLGHFALNSKLIDVIKSTEGSRVVSLTSLYHEKAEMDFEKFNSVEHYDRQRAYADSKMADLMFVEELNRRFNRENVDSKAAAAHPGYASTNLQKRAGRGYGGFVGAKLAGLMNRTIGQPAEKGALNTMYAATNPEIEGGELIGPNGWKRMRGYPEVQEPDDRAQDIELRERLWSYSEKALDIKFEV
jgi:NAD(P)-dependent dehydrogenase (short-subunit alcohol dehydrogenase family)